MRDTLIFNLGGAFGVLIAFSVVFIAAYFQGLLWLLILAMPEIITNGYVYSGIVLIYLAMGFTSLRIIRE